MNIYAAHRMPANIIKLLYILLEVITRQPTDIWIVDELEWKSHTFDENIEHEIES